jgi:KaiC/GvpD/RAD55 family RecA-like ATPase
MNDRVKTGVDSLDSNLQGGFPRGGMILLSGNPGTGKTLLSGEFLYHGAETDENGLYVSFSEGRQSFLECMKRVGRDFTSPGVRDRLEILDLLTVKEARRGAPPSSSPRYPRAPRPSALA